MRQKMLIENQYYQFSHNGTQLTGRAAGSKLIVYDLVTYGMPVELNAGECRDPVLILGVPSGEEPHVRWEKHVRTPTADWQVPPDVDIREMLQIRTDGDA